MRLMKHVDKRAGIYRVRIVVPPAARHAFADLPKSGDYAVSLGTRLEAEAFAKAPPIIANIKARIADALKPAVSDELPEPVVAPVVVFRPTEVQAALERWRVTAIFKRPMFTGCAMTHTTNGYMMGYRDHPGEIILKDARYWMPILNLFHGNRMEEWGGAKIADLKRDEETGVDYLDLRDRQVKTEAAKRLLPLHPTVVAMGFLDYVEERKAAGDGYLFPEFPHDTSEADDPESSTRYFTKWWGFLCDANGIPDPTVNFHSFRHTFKRECRGVISEEIHDLLTGHKGKGGTGRIYGRGGHLEMLAKEIRKVKITDFPLG